MEQRYEPQGCKLLKAGIASLEAQASEDLDDVWKKIFGKDGKK
jgi:hypothetical protein